MYCNGQVFYESDVSLTGTQSKLLTLPPISATAVLNVFSKNYYYLYDTKLPTYIYVLIYHTHLITGKRKEKKNNILIFCDFTSGLDSF